ncbi:DUF2183 domain-containing protein [Maribacter sp. PR1]|uniref:Phosphatase domain-containing protein n=1 Tax=Maribacter cobaltidurans TaxID=1178778 RepID=A0ABU7ITZ6_9FLAO|nr:MULTISPECIES: phosphatase domain-containing protein [Maribacter]MDC6389046.1 DUF2183 domain-containing protein [Maribacter sp. PR1]MEE1976433.1 phosphatase domain-containing protein [Maribacter cobaltidurans]
MKLDLQLYRGYANDTELVVYGHIFESWGPGNYKIDRNGLYHTFSIWKMFSINPLKNVKVTIEFKSVTASSVTNANGFFKFRLPYSFELPPGWHPYTITCQPKNHRYGIIETSELRKPYKTGISVISDIDDTFLVSHSSTIWKKLYVLLTRNVHQRKTFVDVVAHYKALERNQVHDGSPNSFFFVSSSEWNLYYFIIQFSILQKLPKAVLKLKDIKTGILDFLKTGGGNHDHKFHKIESIISFYPNNRYILLGDDSQKDADIYERISATYPKNIKAVYLRQVSKHQKSAIQAKLDHIENNNIPTCYFKSSATAIAHSIKIGIIQDS